MSNPETTKGMRLGCLSTPRTGGPIVVVQADEDHQGHRLVAQDDGRTIAVTLTWDACTPTKREAADGEHLVACWNALANGHAPEAVPEMIRLFPQLIADLAQWLAGRPGEDFPETQQLLTEADAAWQLAQSGIVVPVESPA